MTSGAMAYKEKGNQFFKAGDFAKAIENYTYATEMDPKNPIFYTNRAAAYEHLKKFDKALRDSLKSVKHDPKWAKGYWRAGNAHMGLEDFKSALDSYKQACQLAPDNEAFKASMGKAKRQLMAGQSAAEITKDEGNELFKKGKIESAIERYKEAISCAGTSETELKIKCDIYANLALCYRNLYDNKSAVKACSSALAIDPKHPKALVRRAQAYFGMEKLDEALADYEAAIQAAPSMQSAYQGASTVRQAIRNRAKLDKKETKSR
jgi:tetratricopeptide (TPR) repeat protein